MNQIHAVHGGHEMGTVQDKLPDESVEEIGHSAALDPSVGIAAAVVLATLVTGAGFVIIRRRRRRSLMKRLQEALPEVDEVRASLKRPLRRAVKVL
jgi:hypothetical protein